MAFKKVNTIFVFLLSWVLISIVLFSAFYFSGFAPSALKEFINSASASLIRGPEKPYLVFRADSAVLAIPVIGLASPIVFPTSTDIKVLDKALYSGVVHYPESALPGENGNVFVFGHSTNHPFVKNPAFTAFTKLHELKENDNIIIYSNGVNYYYRVVSVEILDPKETKIYLESKEPKLTLSTCWPVGNPSNRTIVEAKYIGRAGAGS